MKKLFGLYFANLRRHCEEIKIGFYKNIICNYTNHSNFSKNILLIKLLNIISNYLLLF